MRAALSWLIVVGSFVLLIAWCVACMTGALWAVDRLPFDAGVNALLMIPAALAALWLSIWSAGKLMR